MCHTCRGNLTLGLKSHAINVIFYVVLAYSGLYDSRYDYIGGGRFRPKLGLATNFSPYISSIHGHGMFSENVVWYAPHVHFRKILQPRSKNLRACQICSCTAIKTPTAVGSYSCRIYSCRSEDFYECVVVYSATGYQLLVARAACNRPLVHHGNYG